MWPQGGRLKAADYNEGTVDVVKGIKMMQAVGFTLADIKPLADEYAAGKLTSERSRMILITKLQEVEEKERQLAELAAALRRKLSNPHPSQSK